MAEHWVWVGNTSASSEGLTHIVSKARVCNTFMWHRVKGKGSHLGGTGSADPGGRGTAELGGKGGNGGKGYMQHIQMVKGQHI